LAIRYPAGATYAYGVTLHSTIGNRATIGTTAEVEIRILTAGGPNNYEATLRFTRFATTVESTDAQAKAGLVKQSADTDHAAVTMQPVKVKVTPDTFTIESRSPGADYDQPVEMLTQLARADVLPSGPVQVGSSWTRVRTQPIPTMNTSVALHMQCSLVAVGEAGGQPAVTLRVVSTGNAELPAGSLPGSDELARQGLVAVATVGFNTDATSEYRRADAVLLSSKSETRNHMHVKLVGPSPNATAYDTDITSSSTVKLLKAEQPK